MKTRPTLIVTHKHSLYPVLNELVQAHEQELEALRTRAEGLYSVLLHKENVAQATAQVAADAIEELRMLKLDEAPAYYIDEARIYLHSCNDALRRAEGEVLATDAALRRLWAQYHALTLTIPGATFIDRTPSGALILEITNPAMWGEAIAEGHALREEAHLRREARIQHQFNALGERARVVIGSKQRRAA